METQTELPAWAAHALNGVSTRAPRSRLLEPGDILCGEVLELGERKNGSEPDYQTLTIRVEYGRLDDTDVEPGDWICVGMSLKTLRMFMAREKPKPGDRVALQHRGTGKGRAASDVVAGIDREPSGDTPADW